MVDPIGDNPFYVLDLPPDATDAEVERQGQKLLAMLEVGLEDAATYASPLGERARDADLVRRSLDALRDPARRVLHEAWAALPAREVVVPTEAGSPGAGMVRWPSALTALGLG